MQAFLLSAVCQDFQPPRQSGGRSAGASQIVDLLKTTGFTHPHAPHSKKGSQKCKPFCFVRCVRILN